MRLITVAGLLLTLLLAALDQTIVATALPRITAEFGGIAHYAWVTTAYLLTSTLMVPIAAKLSDQFGRKPLLIVGSRLSGDVRPVRAGAGFHTADRCTRAARPRWRRHHCRGIRDRADPVFTRRSRAHRRPLHRYLWAGQHHRPARGWDRDRQCRLARRVLSESAPRPRCAWAARDGVPPGRAPVDDDTPASGLCGAATLIAGLRRC